MQVDIMLFSVDQLQSLLYGSSVLTRKTSTLWAGSVLTCFIWFLQQTEILCPKRTKRFISEKRMPRSHVMQELNFQTSLKKILSKEHTLFCFVCVTNWPFSFPSAVIVLLKKYCNTKNTSLYICAFYTNLFPCHVLPVTLYKQCQRFNKEKSR